MIQPSQPDPWASKCPNASRQGSDVLKPLQLQSGGQIHTAHLSGMDPFPNAMDTVGMKCDVHFDNVGEDSRT